MVGEASTFFTSDVRSQQMLGWLITLYRGKEEDPKVTLAVWQTGTGGLDWLDSLLQQGQAEILQDDGYPNRYRVVARAAVPILRDPPHAHDTWIAAPTDVITSAWLGKTTINNEAIAQCEQDEWLILEAWDES